MLLRIAIVAVVALTALLTGCNEVKKGVAVSGPGRYKAEVSATMLDIKDQIEKSGEINDNTYGKLTNILTNWQEEMGGRSSYHHMTSVKESIDKARANPTESFREMQQAKMSIGLVLDALKTEVQ